MTEGELRIGDVARRVGTTPRTIRYYEQINLLPSARRDPGAHRSYTEEDVERLEGLMRLKNLLGLSLEELRELGDVETARANMRRELREEPDEFRRAELLNESLGYVGRQLELVRRRRDEVAVLEAELLGRRKRIRALMRELSLDDEPLARMWAEAALSRQSG
jgi:MerR family transcriptional regulator, repressor of the yfmOP operon